MVSLRRLLLLAVSTLLALLGAELVVRLAGVAPEVGYVESWRWRLASNPKIGYEPIPHAAPDGESKWAVHRGRANSLGFRDHEHSIRKARGSRRIVVLGDSIAWGYRIERDDDVFPLVLEAELSAAGLAVDVLNFGVSGYNTQQEVETLKEKGLAYRPDLVVLAYCLNDERTADGGLYRQLLALERRGNRMNLTRLSPMLAGSALARYVYYGVLERPEQPPPADRSVFENNVARSFDELGRIAREQGFEVLVVLFPRFDGLKRNVPYRYRDVHARVVEYSERNEFRHLDLLSTFLACRAARPHERISSDLYHPTALGHRCAAKGIAEYILEHVWGA